MRAAEYCPTVQLKGNTAAQVPITHTALESVPINFMYKGIRKQK